MCDFSKRRDVVDDIFWVGDALYEDRFCLFVDSSGERLRCRFCDPLNLDTELLESNLELVVGTAIEVRADFQRSSCQ